MYFELSIIPSNLLYTVTRKIPFKNFFHLRATCKFINNFLERYNDKYKLTCELDFGIDLKNAEEAEFQFNGFLFGIGPELVHGPNKLFVKIDDPLYQIMSVHFKTIDIRAKNGFKCCLSPNDKLNCLMEPRKCLWTMLSTLHLSCDVLELSDLRLENDKAFNLLKYIECKSVCMDQARTEWIPLVSECCENLKVIRFEGELPAFGVINRFKEVEFWDVNLPANETLEDYIMDVIRSKECGRLQRLKLPVYEVEVEDDEIKFPEHIFGLREIFDSSASDHEDVSPLKLYFMKVNQNQMVLVQLECSGECEFLEAILTVHDGLEDFIMSVTEILTNCMDYRGILDISRYYEEMIASKPENYHKVTERFGKTLHLLEGQILEEYNETGSTAD